LTQAPESSAAGRRSLVEATLESLAEKGLGAVSMRDVAARAGVSPGLVRHHFGGFSNLLNEAYRFATQRVEAALESAVSAAGPDPQARMDAFLIASFAPSIADRELLAAWLAFWGLVRSDAGAAGIHAETYTAYRVRIEGLLAALAGAHGTEVDARAGAIGLTAMLDGLWLELCLDPSTFSASEAAMIARSWVQRFVS
jgi:AcrR family transcriptional regulator